KIASPAGGRGGDGPLCGRIVGSAWPRRGVAHDRADRDDAAAFLHERSGCSHRSGDTVDSDGEEGIELIEVVGAVMDLAHGKHAGIVDENIQATEAFDNEFHKLLHFLCLLLVVLGGMCASAL